MNKILTLIILATTLSLLSSLSHASGEIKVTPPSNWQPSPSNNSTTMAWFQNSTKSIFAIIKAPDDLVFPMIFVGPFMSQFFANEGILESADQLTFGHSNYGYRYFLNLSSPSKLLNSSSGFIQNFLPTIPEGYDVPFKGMLILTQKEGDMYAIIFLSPKENFDSILNEIKPTLDSIQLSKSTQTLN